MAARTLYYHNNKQTNKYHYPLHKINRGKEWIFTINKKENKEPK